MRSAFAGGFFVLVVVPAGCVARPRLDGPLPTRNQHPAQLTVLHMAPSAVTTLPAGAISGRVDAAYSNLFLNGGSGGGNTWRMDGEYLRVGTTLRVGLGGDCELAAELPVAHTSGGFLDDFIIGYHDFFGLPDQNRDQNPRDAYDITAQKDGNVAWSVDRENLELLDVPMQVTWQLVAPGDGRVGTAVRGGIELPTGNDDRGYGNGQLDASLGVLLEYRAGGVGWYGHAQHTLAGTPRQSRAVGLHFADVTSLGLGAELPLAENLNVLVQVEWETSTLRHLGFPAVASEQLLLWIGGRWLVTEHWGIEVAFGEDLYGFVSPDFTAWLGCAWLPGAAP